MCVLSINGFVIFLDIILHVINEGVNKNNSFALTSNGFVFSWGQNDWCNLGHDFERDQHVFQPKLINISKVKCISFTEFCTYFLRSDGILYFCGLREGEEEKWKI